MGFASGHVGALVHMGNSRIQVTGKRMTYPVIMNGDHAEFELEHANTPKEQRPDWPLPSFDAMDWAKAFCKIARDQGYRNESGPIDESWMVGWFANALMRGFDEHAARAVNPVTEVI